MSRAGDTTAGQTAPPSVPAATTNRQVALEQAVRFTIARIGTRRGLPSRETTASQVIEVAEDFLDWLDDGGRNGG